MESQFDLWIKSTSVANDIKVQMRAMTPHEVNYYFNLENKLLFGTAGVRALMQPGNAGLNDITYRQLTLSLANYLLTIYTIRPLKVVIGHDNRFHGERFAQECAAVLTSLGIEVYFYADNDLMPTPFISYIVRELGCHAGINITASHNPKMYNGYKLYDHTGTQLPARITDQLLLKLPTIESMLTKTFCCNKKLIKIIEKADLERYFIAAQASLFPQLISNCQQDFLIIFSAHCGTTSYIMQPFLQKLGYTNVILVDEQCHPDPNFTGSPIINPEEPGSFELSIKYANKYGANFMAACDPDGDRLAIVTRNNNESAWHYLTGNEMGILFTYYLLTTRALGNKTPVIVRSFVSSNYVDKILSAYGGVVYESPTGFRCIIEQVNEVMARHANYYFLIAFEEAIGLLNSLINRDKDGFQALALALEMETYYRHQFGFALHEVLEKVIYPKFGFWIGQTHYFAIEGDNWQVVSDKMYNRAKNYSAKNICDEKITSVYENKRGGYFEWVLENNSWIKFRKSGTEPKFKVYYNFYGKSLDEIHNRIRMVHAEITQLFFTN